MTYRTLLVAYVDYTDTDWQTIKTRNNNFVSETDRSVIENDLIIVAIFGLQDPLRPGVRDAVKQS